MKQEACFFRKNVSKRDQESSLTVGIRNFSMPSDQLADTSGKQVSVLFLKYVRTCRRSSLNALLSGEKKQADLPAIRGKEIIAGGNRQPAQAVL